MLHIRMLEIIIEKDDLKGSNQGRNFEKKFPSIYISIKNLLLALKLIYLGPLSQTIYKLTHETKNEKKNYQIIPCLAVPRISRKIFS